MPNAAKKTKRYNIVVSNKPGELAKLTKFLSDESVTVSSMQVANLGSQASILFSTRSRCNLQEGLRRTGLQAQFQ